MDASIDTMNGRRQSEINQNLHGEVMKGRSFFVVLNAVVKVAKYARYLWSKLVKLLVLEY
jgi:hypothetical protein